MDKDAFAASLAADGYEVETVSREANLERPMHHHPFDARGLVLAGEITIETADGSRRSCTAGESFEMAAGREHRETIGPAGATILTGRRRTAKPRPSA